MHLLICHHNQLEGLLHRQQLSERSPDKHWNKQNKNCTANIYATLNEGAKNLPEFSKGEDSMI